MILKSVFRIPDENTWLFFVLILEIILQKIVTLFIRYHHLFGDLLNNHSGILLSKHQIIFI